ncbi:hypothetical protein KSP40_PGU008463 [Platanthera guangdongensis]|uniref:Uncharacterized protein n=1 Tax=Platanthera guangdongensis TaxID=2320717 RepID=A0ABR2MXU6_9ASPA
MAGLLDKAACHDRVLNKCLQCIRFLASHESGERPAAGGPGADVSKELDVGRRLELSLWLAGDVRGHGAVEALADAGVACRLPEMSGKDVLSGVVTMMLLGDAEPMSKGELRVVPSLTLLTTEDGQWQRLTPLLLASHSASSDASSSFGSGHEISKIEGRVLGYGHTDYANTMYHLGMALYLQGRRKIQRHFYRRARGKRVKECRSCGGCREACDCCVARSRTGGKNEGEGLAASVTSMLLKSERLAEAENLQRKILHILEISKGWNLPETLSAAEGLAMILQSLEHFEEAQELLESKAKNLQPTNGEEQPQREEQQRGNKPRVVLGEIVVDQCWSGVFEGGSQWERGCRGKDDIGKKV